MFGKNKTKNKGKQKVNSVRPHVKSIEKGISKKNYSQSQVKHGDKNIKKQKTRGSVSKKTQIVFFGNRLNNKGELNVYGNKKQKSHNKNINYSVVVVLIIVFVVVCGYIFQGFTSLINKTEIPMLTVDYGSADLPTVFSGIIVRDETVYKSNGAGTIYFKYDNLERVRKGTTVCTIQNQAEVDNLNEDLDQLNKKILELQNRREDISPFVQEAKRANERIQIIIDNAQISKSGFLSVYDLKDDIDRSINARNQMLLTESTGSVKDFTDEKEQFEKQLTDNISSINAQQSGILSYAVDGMENILTVIGVDKITPEQTRMKINFDELQHDKQVEVNEDVFKIINSNEWYIALYVPNELTEDWSPNEYRKVFIEKDDEYIEMEVYIQNIVKGETESYMLLKETKNIINFMDMRNVSLKLSNSYHKGLKLPVSAIVDKTLIVIPNEFISDPKKAEVIKKGNEQTPDQTIPIKVHTTDDENTHIFRDANNALNVGDVLVKHDDKTRQYKLEKIENVKGVYLYNKGFADFIKINITNNLQDKNGYVILDPEQNKSIPINSKIITETKNIVDGQKLD